MTASPDGQTAGGPRRRTPPGKQPGWKAVPDSKTQMSAYVDTDVLEAARDAVAALAGRDHAPRNLSDLVTDAIRAEVARLTAQHHAGRPFPARNGDLQAGRPRPPTARAGD